MLTNILIVINAAKMASYAKSLQEYFKNFMDHSENITEIFGNSKETSELVSFTDDNFMNS